MARTYGDVDDMWGHIRWRGSVWQGVNSKRGQALLTDIRDEMVAMRNRGEAQLIPGFIQADGSPVMRLIWEPDTGKFHEELDPVEKYPVGVCAIGCAVRRRLGQAPEIMNQEAEDIERLLVTELNASRSLLVEIGTQNDSDGGCSVTKETPEQRFDRMFAWIDKRVSRNGEKVMGCDPYYG